MSDLPKCQTCRHWAAPQSKYEIGSCAQIRGLEDGGREDLAYGGGYEGYGDYFACSADFGCILHAPRTEAASG